jgi:asparagine synthase (glutamine-hydrolysing)
VVECSLERGLVRKPDDRCATIGRRTILFDGELYEREALARELRIPSDIASDASLVLAAFERWGEETWRRLVGTFTIVAWDDAERVLLAVRDPLGLQPLYRTFGEGTTVLSNSLEAIARHPGVRPRVSAVAIAAVIARRQPIHEELAYANIFRVPQGHVWRTDARGTNLRRYFDPRLQPTTGRTSPFDSAELDSALHRAVERRLPKDRPSVYLSSGIDSFAVAAYATDAGAAHGPDRRPLALSLVVPGEEGVDGAAQQEAAAALDLEQVLRRLPDGIIASALRLAADWPAPLLDAWLPGFLELNDVAVSRGASTIFTGNGGDEWLASPVVAADLLRRRRILDAFELAATYAETYGYSRAGAARVVLWNYGVRPLVAHKTRRPLETHGSRLLRTRLRRLLPGWFLPRADDLQREVFDRPTMSPDASYDSVYATSTGKTYDHPMQDAEMEELYDAGRRTGVRFAHPLFDVDVLRLRYRLDPQDLSPGGRPKGLIREVLERRFPSAPQPTKHGRSTNVFIGRLIDERKAIIGSVGPPVALGDLGVVDPVRFVQDFEHLDDPGNHRHASRYWDALVLESWLRSRA